MPVVTSSNPRIKVFYGHNMHRVYTLLRVTNLVIHLAFDLADVAALVVLVTSSSAFIRCSSACLAATCVYGIQ
jgi:hypothetical protein